MRTLMSTLAVVILLALPNMAKAHCQVPCGIYDDHARIHAMEEDADTIAKAMAKAEALAGKSDAQSVNQLIRWTQTKEEHASHVITTVAEYFLTQKIKPAPAKDKKAHDGYVKRLKACHGVMRAAMKTKQTVDAVHVTELRSALKTLASLFP